VHVSLPFLSLHKELGAVLKEYIKACNVGNAWCLKYTKHKTNERHGAVKKYKMAALNVCPEERRGFCLVWKK
jgi:hypothetical protein